MTAPSNSSETSDRSLAIVFRVVADAPGGVRLPQVFAEHWAGYRSWMRRAPRLDAGHCRAMLERCMPELVGRYDALHDRFGGGEEVGRFLTLYQPPPLVRACTQLVLDDASGPVLLRTYDHHPHLFDGMILGSAWGGVATLVMSDCIWGALDGVNAHGLAIALAFGGRGAVGPGFAAPLVCRYVLQTCTTVAEARDALSRAPVSMTYTFVVVDRAGDFVTAYLSPDRPPTFVTRRASTNHQGVVEWERYVRFTRSEARLARAEALLAERSGVEAARRAFLAPPLWRNDYRRGGGTLYVAEYGVAGGTLGLHWPGRTERIGLGEVEERTFSVALRERAVAGEVTGPSAPV